MSIIEKLDAVKATIPHYWPIGSFIHHNPLKGFEDLHFKDGLKKAKGIFGGNVYMDSSYYMNLYNEGKIESSIFEKNISKVLSDKGFNIPLEFAKKFLMEVSPQWASLRIEFISKKEKIDLELYDYLEANSLYTNDEAWIQKLIEHMTLYEINDALFDCDSKDGVEKNIIEFISRFLDEDQTTMNMPNRELGMFEVFKLYENFDYTKDSATYVEEAFKELHIKDTESYFVTHLLKLHGWAGFIKYRSEDPDNVSQQEYPSSLIDYMAVRLYYELQAVRRSKISTFEEFEAYAQTKLSDVILQILKHKNMLFGVALDELEDKEETTKVLADHIYNELHLDALQIQHSNEVLQSKLPLTELAVILKQLREEEGYIWLKSLEDTYISHYMDEITNHTPPT
ncbi:DUF2309 family protein [Sulfurimonas sp. MAG313]|nr:putative inorganic carbon transporter subunit DabA [Sulfurimonas sp. MAG313]MDF1881700.1 DUF2309 family protein [Sulfurimonas sp. MAG313]